MAHALEARDVAVIEISCRVVGSLALHSPTNQLAIQGAGGCKMVCECLRRCVDDI